VVKESLLNVVIVMAVCSMLAAILAFGAPRAVRREVAKNEAAANAVVLPKPAAPN
jgi:DHA1 family bicyclomycin/chloramphenicol resistance-like MFS transporter